MERIGRLSRDQLLPFVLEYARNDSRFPLPKVGAAHDEELWRRAQRVAPILTGPFGLLGVADVFNHLLLIEKYYSDLPAMETTNPICAVLEPPEFRCPECPEHPELVTVEDAGKGIRGSKGLLILKENEVLEGFAYKRECRECYRVFYYDRVAERPTLEDRAAGRTEPIVRCALPFHLPLRVADELPSLRLQPSPLALLILAARLALLAPLARQVQSTRGRAAIPSM